MLSLGTVLPLGLDPDPREFAEVYRLAGASSAQMCRPQESGLSPRQVLEIAAGLPLPIDSMHGFFGPQYDISSPDESRRQSACRAVGDEVRFCRDIGGRLLVIHPRGGTMSLADAPIRSHQLGDSLDELAGLARESGVRIAVENLDSAGFGADPRDLATVIRGCAQPAVGLCVDLGHAHASGVAIDHLAGLGSCVACIHAADTEPGQDLHLLPGHGSVPWQQYLNALQAPDGTLLCLEVFEPLDKARSAITPAWLEFLDGLLRAVARS